MRALLDTRILLWMAFDEERHLKPDAVTLLEDADNGLHFSLASLWEISIKASLGKPGFTVDVMALDKGLRSAGIQELPIRLPHIVQSGALSLIHRDPFDRLLLAQAETEQMQLMTADSMLLKYRSPWVPDAAR